MEEQTQGGSSIFDSVFRTMVQKMTKLLVPLVNHVFHKDYPEDVSVVQLRNEHMEAAGKIIADCIFLIGGDFYHIECQSRPDGTMVLRMIEYDFAIALEHSEHGNVRLPASCVLYLRHGENTPDYLTLTVWNAEGDSMPYRVRVVKLQEYSLERIFSEQLLLFLPYYILRYEKQFPEIERDTALRARFMEDIQAMSARLDTLATDEDAEVFYNDLRNLIQDIANYLLARYEATRKEVEHVVRGEVLILPSELKESRREGREEGRKEGREEGKVLAFAECVRNGELSLPAVLRIVGMTEDEFTRLARKYGSPIDAAV